MNNSLFALVSRRAELAAPPRRLFPRADMKRFAKLALEEHGQQAGAVGGGSSGAAQGGRA